MAANSSDVNLIGIVDSALEVLRGPALWILAVITFVIIGYVNHRTKRWSKRRWSVFELQDVLPEYRSDTPLKLIRNTFLGGAAVCLASLLGILQVGASDEALRIAVYGAAIGMPSWLCAAGCYEAMLTLGPKSYEWLLTRIGRNVGPIPALAGTFALLACLAGIIYHLVPDAILTFAVASGVGVAIVYFVLTHLVIRQVVVKEASPRRRI